MLANFFPVHQVLLREVPYSKKKRKLKLRGCLYAFVTESQFPCKLSVTQITSEEPRHPLANRKHAAHCFLAPRGTSEATPRQHRTTSAPHPARGPSIPRVPRSTISLPLCQGGRWAGPQRADPRCLPLLLLRPWAANNPPRAGAALPARVRTDAGRGTVPAAPSLLHELSLLPASHTSAPASRWQRRPGGLAARARAKFQNRML